MPMQSLRLITTRAAERRLSQQEKPLHVEMELLFSCLIRKRVLFRIPEGGTTYPMVTGDERVNISFRPVMTKVCMASDVEGLDDLELEDFPVQRAEAFMPRWLRLDFSKGQWQGDFGWLGAERM
jgi:hypothetical protein